MANDMLHYRLEITSFGSSRKFHTYNSARLECLLYLSLYCFSLDELVNYDAPAAIDKVLVVSGKDSLYWIGHSQGAAVGFMTLADNQKYNRKVCRNIFLMFDSFFVQLKALFQLGPVGTSGYAKGMMRFALFAYKYIKPLVDVRLIQFLFFNYSCQLYRLALGSHEIIIGHDSVYISLCEFSPFNVSEV